MAKRESTGDISAKSTKNEILEAYQQLLEKMNESRQLSYQDVKKQQDEETIISKASELTVDHIVNNLTHVKLSVTQELDNLEQHLVKEYRTLNELQTAIKLEKQNLEDLHQIKSNADSLAVLFQAQKEYKAKFEQQMEEAKLAFERQMIVQKAQWEKEQQEYAEQKLARDTQLKRERQREEEEYTYSLELERKKEHDSYETRKATLERELTEKRTTLQKEFTDRENLIATREEEYKQLKKQVALFPEELAKAVQEAETKAVTALENQYKYKMDLTAKESEGEKKLNAQIITSLKEKIKEQDEYIKQLTQKTNDAGVQVQTIALKALESSSIRGLAFDEPKKSSSQMTL